MDGPLVGHPGGARGHDRKQPSDDEFRAAFSALVLDPRGPRKALVRYLLSQLEVGVGGKPIDFDGSDVTIEHILPDNPSTGREAFTHEDRQREVKRLGNLTPLEYGLNKGLGNSAYGVKLPVYARSGYHLTRQITLSEWTPAAIRGRQVHMAEVAAQIWRIDDAEGALGT